VSVRSTLDTPFRDDRVLDREAAAALLEVPPAALRTWTERLAFPREVAVGTYVRDEIEALREALPEAHSVVGAVQAARRRVGG